MFCEWGRVHLREQMRKREAEMFLSFFGIQILMIKFINCRSIQGIAGCGANRKKSRNLAYFKEKNDCIAVKRYAIIFAKPDGSLL